MAHRRQLSHDASATGAIFSPSVARVAASTARDWTYVDGWLSAKFNGRPVPSFERNQDTLRVLLELAALNETADDDRVLLAQAEADACSQIAETAHNESSRAAALRRPLLQAIHDGLTKDGDTALDSMAQMAVHSSTAYPEPSDLGRELLRLQSKVFETEQMIARVDVLRSHLQREATDSGDLTKLLQSEPYRPQPGLAKQNIELQRKTKTASLHLPDLLDRAASLSTSSNDQHPTVEDIAREEQEYIALLARKKELDAQMAAFAGLPSDPDMARSELDDLRRKLHGVTSHRDAAFEGLVERESPAKPRR